MTPPLTSIVLVTISLPGALTALFNESNAYNALFNASYMSNSSGVLLNASNACGAFFNASNPSDASGAFFNASNACGAF